MKTTLEMRDALFRKLKAVAHHPRADDETGRDRGAAPAAGGAHR